MALDDVFNPDLRDYIIATTSPESALLYSLRQETATATNSSRMLSGPVVGKLLHLLIKISGAKLCLELGTFTGYSALHIASALPKDGKLITCEIRQEYAAIAQKYFDLSPFGHKIELRLNDAKTSIFAIDPFLDFILIDADKAQYPFYYESLVPKLRPGGLMVVDNALWDGEVIAPHSKGALAIHTLNRTARHDARVETVLLSVRDGILLIRKY